MITALGRLARMNGWAGAHYPTTKKQPQHHPHNLLREQNGQIRQRTMDIDPPRVKPWSKENKDFLQELIDTGKVDIGRSTDTKYINRVRAKYFCDHDEHNFHRNFWSYDRSRELEDRLSGYRRRGGGIVFFIYYSYYLHHY